MLPQKITCNRAFFILALHYLIIFVVISFSIGFLTFNSQTNYHSGVLALLSACIGYIIPGPKAWTKKIYTDPHCFISITGPGGCGKTKLISQIIPNQKSYSDLASRKFCTFISIFNWLRMAFAGMNAGKTTNWVSSRTSMVSSGQERGREAKNTSSYWRPVSRCLWRWNVSQLGCCWKTSNYTSDDFET